MNSSLFATIPILISAVRGSFGVRDFFDVLIVALFVYIILMLLKRTRSYFVVGGVFILFLVYTAAKIFGFILTGLLLQYFFTFLIVILLVVFQQELRNFFEWVYVLGVFAKKKSRGMSGIATVAILSSIEELARKKIGAIVVLSGSKPLDQSIEGGFVLGGQVSQPLLLSIFDPSSPGHDGAVVIEGDRIVKFGCHLPLAQKYEQFGDIGTRHRSSLGLAQQSDAFIIIVSEERGTISVAHNGELRAVDSAESLREEIRKFVAESDGTQSWWNQLLLENWREKAISLGAALLLWFVLVFRFGASY